MNKTEFISAVAAVSNKTNKETAEVINAALDVLCQTLREGNSLRLTGFGNLEVRQRNARKAKNPRTGEDVTVEATKAVVFKPGKALKDQLNRK